jgi:hypothetical protein
MSRQTKYNIEILDSCLVVTKTPQLRKAFLKYRKELSNKLELLNANHLIKEVEKK